MWLVGTNLRAEGAGPCPADRRLTSPSVENGKLGSDKDSGIKDLRLAGKKSINWGTSAPPE